MSSSSVVVLDHGGGSIKIGLGGERDPSTIVSNCTARSPGNKKLLMGEDLGSVDPTSLSLRCPSDRGYLINPELQRDIWSHLLKSLGLSSPVPSSSLLLTQPPFALSLPTLRRPLFDLVCEEVT